MKNIMLIVSSKANVWRITLYVDRKQQEYLEFNNLTEALDAANAWDELLGLTLGITWAVD